MKKAKKQKHRNIYELVLIDEGAYGEGDFTLFMTKEQFLECLPEISKIEEEGYDGEKFSEQFPFLSKIMDWPEHDGDDYWMFENSESDYDEFVQFVCTECFVFYYDNEGLKHEVPINKPEGEKNEQ